MECIRAVANRKIWPLTQLHGQTLTNKAFMMHLSTFVVSEFEVRQSVADLGLNKLVLRLISIREAFTTAKVTGTLPLDVPRLPLRASPVAPPVPRQASPDQSSCTNRSWVPFSPKLAHWTLCLGQARMVDKSNEISRMPSECHTEL